MGSESISDNFRRLNEDVKSFAKSTAEYYKLALFSKTLKGATTTVKAVLAGFFFLFAFNLISLGLAIWISDAIGVASSGFFIVGGFYLLLICLILFVLGKYIDRFMLQQASRKFFNQPDEDELENYREDERI